MGKISLCIFQNPTLFLGQPANLPSGALTQFNHQFSMDLQNFLGFGKQVLVNALPRLSAIDGLFGFMFVYGGVNPASFLIAHVRGVGDDQVIITDSVFHWIQRLPLSEFKAVQAVVLLSILAGHS